MQDHVSRLVGLEGFEVKRVVEDGERLDLEVELVRAPTAAPPAGAPRWMSRIARGCECGCSTSSRRST